jgi:type IV pilus assembly protein PilP
MGIPRPTPWIAARWIAVMILGFLVLIDSKAQEEPAPSEQLAAPVPQASTQPSAAPSPSDSGPLSEEILSMRDPFKRNVADGGLPVLSLGPLESYPVDRFKLIGAITGTDRVRAILQDPMGRTHIVSERAKIGIKGGKIVEIRSNRVRVREQVVNAIGQEEQLMTDIPLDSGASPTSPGGYGEGGLTSPESGANP